MNNYYEDNEESIICEYEKCKKVFERPIMLMCCGESICEQHLNDLYIQTEKSNTQKLNQKIIRCCFCRDEFPLPPKGLPLNKVIHKLINADLGRNHKHAKTSLADLIDKLSKYDQLKSDTRNFIYKYFQNIKNDTDINREEVKQSIDNYYDSLLDDLNRYQEECESRINVDDFQDNFDPVRDKIELWKTETKRFIINDSRWSKINDEIKSNINEIDSKIAQIEDKLLDNKVFYFQANPLQHISLDLFGKIIINESLNRKSYYLMSCGQDNQIKLWNVDTGECHKTLNGHTSSVESIKLLSNDKLLSCSQDKALMIWNVRTGNYVKAFHFDKSFPSCFTTLDSSRFICGFNNGIIKIWDLDESLNINEFKTFKYDSNSQISVDKLELLNDNQLASCSRLDETIRIWNLDVCKCIKVLIGHSGGVYDIKSALNCKLISGSSDNMVKIWDLNKGECVATLEGHQQAVVCVEVLPNNRIISGSLDKSIKIWDFYANSCIKTINQAHLDSVCCLKYLPNDRFISGSQDKFIKIWSLKDYECLRVIEGHTASLNCLDLLEKIN